MSNETISGKFDQLKGQVKQSIGEAVGNEKLANEGAADQVKGAAKEAWGNTKDAAHAVADDSRSRTDLHTSNAEAEAHENAHSVRDSVVNSAEKLKNSVVAHTDNIKANH